MRCVVPALGLLSLLLVLLILLNSTNKEILDEFLDLLFLLLTDGGWVVNPVVLVIGCYKLLGGLLSVFLELFPWELVAKLVRDMFYMREKLEQVSIVEAIRRVVSDIQCSRRSSSVFQQVENAISRPSSAPE